MTAAAPAQPSDRRQVGRRTGTPASQPGSQPGYHSPAWTGTSDRATRSSYSVGAYTRARAASGASGRRQRLHVHGAATRAKRRVARSLRAHHDEGLAFVSVNLRHQHSGTVQPSSCCHYHHHCHSVCRIYVKLLTMMMAQRLDDMASSTCAHVRYLTRDG